MKNLKLIPNKFKISILIFILLPINLIAQEESRSSPTEIIKLFNESQSYYSLDDEIINGCVYPLPDSRINGHPYLNDQWIEATFFVNSKKYPKLSIKYDLTIDDVILKAEIENGMQKLINLNKFKIDSFLVGNSLFVNSHFISKEEKEYTYFEQIYKGKYSLYKEYKKIFIKEYNNITPYGKYSSLRMDIYLYDNNKQINVNRETLFIKCFEKEKQHEIKSFMKRNNIKYKKASQQELKQLMEFCTQIISN
ncbi:MAG: hypothetical protein KAQ75_09040 [Bacteroidales bacterium]|nr:hypothetical protein [Bacteroidales bacterium]